MSKNPHAQEIRRALRAQLSGIIRKYHEDGSLRHYVRYSASARETFGDAFMTNHQDSDTLDAEVKLILDWLGK